MVDKIISNKNFLVVPSRKFNFVTSKLITNKLRGRKNVVVTGGRSFIPIYKKINFIKLNLKQKYYLSDERLVSISSKNSNFFNINKFFNLEQLFFFKTSYKSKKKILENFNVDFKSLKIDLSLLSFGEDGHVASIFFDKMKSERQLFFSHRNFNRISIPLTILKRAKETLVFCNTTKKTLNIIKDIEKGRNFFKYFDKKKYKIIIKKTDYEILAKKLDI